MCTGIAVLGERDLHGGGTAAGPWAEASRDTRGDGRDEPIDGAGVPRARHQGCCRRGAGPDGDRGSGSRAAALPGRPAGGRDAAAQGGGRVGYAPVGHCADLSHDDGGAAVFVATCPQRDGTQAAVAAAASAADRVAMAAARSAVDEWSAVFGSRRLLAAGSPWCRGATQALAAARRAVDGRRAVHVYGQLAADWHAISELTELGAVLVRSLDEIPDGATVVFPAHGDQGPLRARPAERNQPPGQHRRRRRPRLAPLTARTPTRAPDRPDPGPAPAAPAPATPPPATPVPCGALLWAHAQPAGLLSPC